MEDADFSFTPLNAWQDKLLDVSDIIDTQKAQFSENALAGRRLYNGTTKKRSYYGVPMKVATTTFHVWQSLVEKAGYKVSDIPNTWDAYIDFFLPMQEKLRAQGMRNLYAMSLECSTNGVDPIATFNSYMIAYGGKDLVTPDGKLHTDDPQVKEAVIKTLTRLSKLFKDGYVPSSAVNWNDQDNNNSFHAKEVINCFNGSMSIELAQVDQKEEYNDQMTRAVPNGNDGKPLPAQAVEFGAVIPKGAKNLALAKEFLKYVIQPEVLNAYLKGGLGRWAVPYPSIIKSDPFWLKSGDPHRLAYITETIGRPDVPALRGIQSRRGTGRFRACVSARLRRHHAQRDDARGRGGKGVQASGGNFRPVPDPAELRGWRQRDLNRDAGPPQPWWYRLAAAAGRRASRG
jgi:multiple sugar transport system substrate-binding protein